VALPL